MSHSISSARSILPPGASMSRATQHWGSSTWSRFASSRTTGDTMCGTSSKIWHCLGMLAPQAWRHPRHRLPKACAFNAAHIAAPREGRPGFAISRRGELHALRCRNHEVGTISSCCCAGSEDVSPRAFEQSWRTSRPQAMTTTGCLACQRQRGAFAVHFADLLRGLAHFRH